MNKLDKTNETRLVQVKPLTEKLYYQWIAYLDVRPKTEETYQKSIRQFFQYTKKNDIVYPTREDIIRWRENLKVNHKPNTVQNYLTAVKLFFQWLELEGIYQNITQKIKGAKIDQIHKKDYLTSNQSRKVLTSINQDTLKGKRDYAIFSLMVTTGLRTIEISRADIKDLRTLGDTMVLYIQGKGHDEKTEFVKVAPQVEDAIRTYLNNRKAQQDEPLFTSTSHNNYGKRMTTRSISAIVKDNLIRAGFDSDRLTAHSLRHTAGTLALMNGASLEEVQQILRHTSINTTMIYLHAFDRVKNNSELKVANAIFESK